MLSVLKTPKDLSLIKDNLDGFGEAFRALFFDETDGRGCYASFDLRDFIVELPPRKIEEDEGQEWTRASYTSNNGQIYVVMEYYWDGDGTLVFYFPNYEYCLVNSDCKKDYTWEWLKYSEVQKWECYQ